LSARWVFAAVALAAAVAGSALWFLGRPSPRVERAAVSPTALYAANFTDEAGASQALGRYQGKLLVLNFWATWCGPCREEIPAFARVQQRWASRNVQFLGLSDEDREKVARFTQEVRVNYPLWVGNGVADLGRRLGNRLGVLPFTVIVGPTGEILDTKVGAYSEREIDQKIAVFAAK
jgi:thiol-disulfide isomerase/thioredoxin